MKWGFTLIESLLAVSIIGLLAYFLLPALSTAREKAIQARVRAELQQIMTAADLVYNAYGYYPNDSHGSVTCPSDIIIANGKMWGEFVDLCNDPWGNKYEWNNLCHDGLTTRKADGSNAACLPFSDAKPGPLGITAVGKNGVNDNCTGDDICLGRRGHSLYNWRPLVDNPPQTENWCTTNPTRAYRCTNVCNGKAFSCSSSTGSCCGTCQQVTSCKLTSGPSSCPGSGPSLCSSNSVVTGCKSSPASCPVTLSGETCTGPTSVVTGCRLTTGPNNCPQGTSPTCGSKSIAVRCRFDRGPSQCSSVPAPSLSACTSPTVSMKKFCGNPGPPWSCTLTGRICAGGPTFESNCTAKCVYSPVLAACTYSPINSSCSYNPTLSSCTYNPKYTTSNNTTNSTMCTDSCGGSSCTSYVKNYTCTNACTGQVTTQITPCATTCSESSPTD